LKRNIVGTYEWATGFPLQILAPQSSAVGFPLQSRLVYQVFPAPTTFQMFGNNDFANTHLPK